MKYMTIHIDKNFPIQSYSAAMTFGLHELHRLLQTHDVELPTDQPDLVAYFQRAEIMWKTRQDIREEIKKLHSFE